MLLGLSGQHANDIERQFGKIILEEFPQKNGWPIYDILTFETMAWCHFYLLSEFIPELDEGEMDDLPIFAQLLFGSVNFSNAFFQKFIHNNNLSDAFFIERTLSYSNSNWETHLRNLLYSLKTGSPQPSPHLELGDGLLSSVYLAASIPIFTNTVLETFKINLIKMYDSEISKTF
jgi:hypothetical protein